MVIKNSGIERIPFLKIKQIGICGTALFIFVGDMTI